MRNLRLNKVTKFANNHVSFEDSNYFCLILIAILLNRTFYFTHEEIDNVHGYKTYLRLRLQRGGQGPPA